MKAIQNGHYKFTNQYGWFIIERYGEGKYHVGGNRRAAQHAFKMIGRKAPNDQGYFFGREKAGYAACEELISTTENEKIK